MINLKDKIAKKIKEEKIKPTEHWQFAVKQLIIWMSVIVLVAITSMITSTIIFNLENTDWMMHRRLGFGLGKFIFMSMPYFWLIILAGLIGLAYYLFKQTKKGYQYALPIIIFIIILLSIGFGWISHRSFMGGRLLEQRAMKSMPYYDKMTRYKQAVWQNPEKGFLIGQVASKLADSKFKLIDINKKTWVVGCDECLISKGVELNKDNKVKIIGAKVDEFVFEAKEIIMFFREKGMNETRLR